MATKNTYNGYLVLPDDVNLSAIRTAIAVANGHKARTNELLKRANISGRNRYLAGSLLYQLRDWLTQIVENGHIVPSVRNAIAKRITSCIRTASQIVFEDKQLRPQIQIKIDGVSALCTYAVALLVSANGDGLAKRVGRCQKCGTFFLDEKQGAGRRRLFCSPAHKNAHMQWKFKNPHKQWQVPDVLEGRPTISYSRSDGHRKGGESELLQIVKDPGINERKAGKALLALGRRGIDPTGKRVGRVKAKRAARDYGDMAPG